MKREMKTVFIFLLTLFSLNLVSASFHYYGRFSFRNLFYGVDSSTMAFIAFFIIIFIFVFMGMSRVLKDPYGNPNTGSAVIASLAFSFLVTYGISRTRFDLGYLLFQLESSGLLWLIVISIIILSVLYILSRFGRGREFRLQTI